jgi:hypothetical protein
LRATKVRKVPPQQTATVLENNGYGVKK